MLERLRKCKNAACACTGECMRQEAPTVGLTLEMIRKAQEMLPQWDAHVLQVSPSMAQEGIDAGLFVVGKDGVLEIDVDGVSVEVKHGSK